MTGATDLKIFFDEKEYDAFEAGACDLAFAIWKKDKDIFEKIIQSGKHFFSKTYLPEEKKDATIEELQAKITELENQLQAQQSAVSPQEVLPASNLDENYNPTERETHLLMIYAMAKLLTNQHFNVNKYIRGKNINKKQISEDVTEHITKVLNTPETKPRSLETIRKRLDEALRLNEQAD